MSETVLPTTQTTSPTTPHCRRLSPRWSALWAPHHPEPRPHRQQTGGIAPIEARHAEARLLMLQNPPPLPPAPRSHPGATLPPRRHAPTPAPRSHPGVTLPPRRHVPLVVRRCSARPCWASGMELMAGVATSLGGPRWRRGGLASSATALVADEALRPIGKSRPL